MLAGGKTFRKLDMSQTYQQIRLDEESQSFVTVDTHQGVFSYKRQPFGDSSTPGIFQHIMESLLKDIPGVIIYIDDGLITVVTQDKHPSSTRRSSSEDG